MMRRLAVGVGAVLMVAGCSQPAPPATSEPVASPVVSSSSPTAGVPASSAAPSVPASSESAPSTPPAKDALDLAITLADGTAEPNGERLDVPVGTTVVITVTSDRDDEVHVHGYDLEIPVKAGRTVTKEFVADETGSFEIESHEPELLIVRLQVR